MLIDNVLWGGSVANLADKDADTRAIRALNAKLKADERVDLALFAVGDRDDLRTEEVAIVADAYSYRNDPAVPSFPDDRPVVIFDGNCVLCSAFAQFILRTDRRRRFRLMAAQTPLGAALYEHYGLSPTTTEPISCSRMAGSG